MTASDVLFAGCILFALAISFLIGNYMVHTITDKLTIVPQINDTPEVYASLKGGENASNQFDYVLFGVFIGLILAIIVTSWYVAGNPIFTFVYFLVVIIAITVTFFLSNAWETVSTMSVFSATIGNFPITNFILGKLPIFITIIGVLGLVVMFGKPYISDQQ